jgi:hypothetical protein
MGRLERPAMTGEMTGTTSDDGAAAPRAGGGGGGSSDPRAGSDDGFRCRSHGVRAGSARIDRVGLTQAWRRSAVSDASGSEGRRWSLLRPYGGAQGAAAAAGAAERGVRAVRDCGQQRGGAGRRHAAPWCALRPSLPLVFSSRSVQLWRPAEALCCCCVEFLCSDSSVPAQNTSEGLRGQAFARLKRRTNGRDWLLSQHICIQPNSRFSWHLLAEPLLLQPMHVRR